MPCRKVIAIHGGLRAWLSGEYDASSAGAGARQNGSTRLLGFLVVDMSLDFGNTRIVFKGYP